MKQEPVYPFYGQSVGVLVFSAGGPRLPGDAGHSRSFSYPVRYEVVEGSFMDLVQGSESVKANILDACKRLAALNIKAIVGECGLMSLYQAEMGALCGALFAGSSLCQLPMIWELIGRAGTIGIITGHAGLLGRQHLLSSGWREEMHLCIQGMQDEPHFAEIVIRGGRSLDAGRMRQDVLAAGEKLMLRAPDLRAVVLECGNLATYSQSLRSLLGVPVFDTISAANLLAYATDPPSYGRFDDSL